MSSTAQQQQQSLVQLVNQMNLNDMGPIGQLIGALLQVFFPHLNFQQQQTALSRVTGTPINTDNAPDFSRFDVGELQQLIERTVNGPLVPNFSLTHTFDEDITLDDLHKAIEDMIIEAKDLYQQGQQIMPGFRESVEDMRDALNEGGPDALAKLHAEAIEMALDGISDHATHEMTRNMLENQSPVPDATTALDTQEEVEFIARAVKLIQAANEYALENGLDPDIARQNIQDALDQMAEKMGIDPEELGVSADALMPKPDSNNVAGAAGPDAESGGNTVAVNSEVNTAIAAIDSFINASNSGDVILINSTIDTAIAAIDSIIDMSNSGTIIIENSHVQTAISAIDSMIDFHNDGTIHIKDSQIQTAISAIDSVIDLHNSGDITIENSHLETAIASINALIDGSNESGIIIENQEIITAIAALGEKAQAAGLDVAIAATDNAGAIALRNDESHTEQLIETSAPEYSEEEQAIRDTIIDTIQNGSLIDIQPYIQDAKIMGIWDDIKQELEQMGYEISNEEVDPSRPLTDPDGNEHDPFAEPISPEFQASVVPVVFTDGINENLTWPENLLQVDMPSSLAEWDNGTVSPPFTEGIKQGLGAEPMQKADLGNTNDVVRKIDGLDLA